MVALCRGIFPLPLSLARAAYVFCLENIGQEGFPDLATHGRLQVSDTHKNL